MISDWNFDMASAPRDGTLLQLLISHEGDESWNGFDDNDPSRTMGFNNFDNDDDNVWRFPGWSWTQDYIIEQGQGKPVAWAPMLPLPEAMDSNGG